MLGRERAGRAMCGRMDGRVAGSKEGRMMGMGLDWRMEYWQRGGTDGMGARLEGMEEARQTGRIDGWMRELTEGRARQCNG